MCVSSKSVWMPIEHHFPYKVNVFSNNSSLLLQSRRLRTGSRNLFHAHSSIRLKTIQHQNHLFTKRWARQLLLIAIYWYRNFSERCEKIRHFCKYALTPLWAFRVALRLETLAVRHSRHEHTVWRVLAQWKMIANDLSDNFNSFRTIGECWKFLCRYIADIGPPNQLALSSRFGLTYFREIDEGA